MPAFILREFDNCRIVCTSCGKHNIKIDHAFVVEFKVKNATGEGIWKRVARYAVDGGDLGVDGTQLFHAYYGLFYHLAEGDVAFERIASYHSQGNISRIMTPALLLSFGQYRIVQTSERADEDGGSDIHATFALEGKDYDAMGVLSYFPIKEYNCIDGSARSYVNSWEESLMVSLRQDCISSRA